MKNRNFAAPVTGLMMLAGHCAAQIVPLEPWQDNPAAFSSQFGFSMAQTSKHLWIGAPNFKVGDDFGRGRCFIFESKTLAPFNPSNLGETGGVREGTALAASKFEVVVGLPDRTVSAAADAGSVVYYTYKTGASPRIHNPFPAANDRFGQSVAIGKQLIVIGAPGDAGGTGPATSGSAFAVRTTDMAPVRLLMPSYTSGDEAGTAVAVSKKYIAVGAPGTFVSTLPDQGAVHIYDAKTFNYLTTLTGAHIFGTAPRFGSSLAFSGKYLFVGSPTYDYGIADEVGYRPAAGRVTQFDTRTWNTVRAFNASEPASSADYGATIHADKKYLAVGSRKHFDDGIGESGKAEVFSIRTGERVADLLSPAPSQQQHYGTSVLLLKGNRVAVGAPSETSTSTDGTVYVHTFQP